MKYSLRDMIYLRYEIALTRSEIKFTNYTRSVFHSVSYFTQRSCISLAAKRISLKNPKRIFSFRVFCGSGGGVRTSRPPGYEPDELPIAPPRIKYCYYTTLVYACQPFFGTLLKRILSKLSQIFCNYYIIMHHTQHIDISWQKTPYIVHSEKMLQNRLFCHRKIFFTIIVAIARFRGENGQFWGNFNINIGKCLKTS